MNRTNWTDDEVETAWMAWRDPSDPHVPEKALNDAMRRVMTRAVELAAARGGDALKDDVPSEADLLTQVQGVSLNEGGGVWRREAMRARAHAAALGATVATLQAQVAEMEKTLSGRESANTELASERSALRTEVERLKAEVKDSWNAKTMWKERAYSAESRLAASRERLTTAREHFSKVYAHYSADEIERANPTSQLWCWRQGMELLEGDASNTPEIPDDSTASPQEALPCRCSTGEPVFCRATRHPCSPTCTHDDAAMPGHPSRVKGRSEAFLAASASPVDPAEPLAHIAWSDGRRSGHEDGWYKGSEAMRAACWEAVRFVLEVEGFSEAGPSGMYERFKSAIEGAAP